jgi:4-hydroxy-tetrahydrodipicolinate reductase
VSDHEAGLTFVGEMLSIKHGVTDRVAAGRGALAAARWIAGRQPGLYKMADVYASHLNTSRREER